MLELLKYREEHMVTSTSTYSKLSEKELFDSLTHVPSGSSEDHKKKRIKGLEELQRRIESSSIQDMDNSVEILLEMAKKQGLKELVPKKQNHPKVQKPMNFWKN